MICPKCGTKNGDTNKFCRECGGKLDNSLSGSAGLHDDLALGEALFSVWRLFEAGRLDEALVEGEKIAYESPDSTSTHSLVALIYERKAARELEVGNTSGAHQFLQLAIEHYEKVVNLNPDSGADREKLTLLRMRLAGQLPAPKSKPRISNLKTAFAAIPMPVRAGFGAFLLALIVAIILIPGGKQEPQVRVSTTETDRSASSHPLQDIGKREPPSTPPERSLSVYTFPSTSAAGRDLVPTPPESRATQQESPPKPAVKPAALPALGPELTLIPEPKRTEPPKSKPSASASTKEAEPKPAQDDSSHSGPTGRSMFAEAIRLYNAGQPQEAIGAAEQAIALYQADVEAGRNVDEARRGIDNAKKQIKVWQQSVVVTVEEQ